MDAISLATESGWIAAVAPNVPKILKRLLPITLPTATSPCLRKAAITVANNSGKEVPGDHRQTDDRFWYAEPAGDAGRAVNEERRTPRQTDEADDHVDDIDAEALRCVR